MESTTILILLGLVALVVYMIMKASSASGIEGDRATAKNENLPYKIQKYFFTKSESAFYKELKSQLGDRYDIFPKVRIIDFIDVIPGSKNYSKWRNKIWSKHIDFLLCEKENHNPIIAIEVNGSSHNSKKAQARDTFVSKVYSTVGIKYVAISVGEDFAEEIRKIASADSLG